MSSPVAQCTITGTWPETDNSKATGRYIVTPLFEALGDGVLVPVTDVPVTLDAQGTGTRTLGYIPGVTQWKITEQIDSADQIDPYVVTPEGDTLDLSTAPRSAAPGVPVNQFLLASSMGHPGGPGGPLREDGTLPPAQIPGGGSGGITSITTPNGTLIADRTGSEVAMAVGEGIPQSAIADLTADLAALVPLDTITAKGDLIIGTGTGEVARLPVGGTTGDALVVDPTAPNGISYQPVGGGGGGGTVKAFTMTVFEQVGGSITPPDSGGTWGILFQVDGTTMFSRTVPAEAGELLTVNQNDMFRATDSQTHFDLGVIVGGEIVRYLSNMDLPARPSVEGDPGWYPNSTDFKWHPAPPEWIAEASDIDGGNVTVAIVYRGGTGTFYAEQDYPFRMSMKNLGTPTTVV